MRRLLMTTVLTAACATAPLAGSAAGPVAHSAGSSLELSGPETLWLAKEHKADKAKGPKKEKPQKKNRGANKGQKDKPEKAKRGSEAGQAGSGKQDKANKSSKDKSAKGDDKGKADRAPGRDRADMEDRVNRFDERREATVERLMQTPAPAGRDMAAILGAAGLAMAAPTLSADELDDDAAITYRNCPPGLAKKDPPCVPPGLAKKGVTYEEWANLSEEELDALLAERRAEYLSSDRLTERELLLLNSDQIATLYGLDPAPEGQRYALIDGQPVILDTDDYTALLRINELARVAEIGEGINIAPTAALTQEDLMRLYRLPAPAEGYSYAVLNGQVIALEDSAYETLQLIRIVRAVL